MITVEVLLNGGSSQIIALPDKYRFSSTTARDAYFKRYSTELVFRTWIMVEDQLQQWNGLEWINFTTVITGPSGRSFEVVGTVSSVDELPDVETVETNEAYLVGGYVDGTHLFIVLSSTKEWFDYGPMNGIKGDPGEAPLFEIRENGHLYALYESEIGV